MTFDSEEKANPSQEGHLDALVPSATSTVRHDQALYLEQSLEAIRADGNELKSAKVLEESPYPELESKDAVVDPDDQFPDGGRGWLVVLGAALNTFVTFGLVNSWAVFQSFYQTDVMPTVNPSTIAWIGSVQYSLVFFPGLISGRLFDLGYFHLPLGIASVVIVAATLLVAECKEFWQFMLTQGIATGIGCGFTFGPSLPAVSHWFKRRRSTAFGVVASGSSVGGTLFPIAVRKLIPIIGFKWTIRVVALILCVILTLSNLLLKRRLPPVNISGGLFNPKAFRSAPYSLFCTACFIGYLGMYTVLTYIDISAIQFGISADFSFYLVSLVNAGSLLGRLSSGILSDKFGCLNVLIPFSTISAAATYVWPYCRNKESLIALAVIYGIASGAFVGLIAAPVASLGQTGDLGRRTGMLFTFCAISSLCGPPISGAILTQYGGNYVNVGAYAGTMILGSTFFMILTRWKALGGLWGKF